MGQYVFHAWGLNLYDCMTYGIVLNPNAAWSDSESCCNKHEDLFSIGAAIQRCNWS